MTDAEKAALQKDRKFLGKALDLIPGYKKLRATGFGQLMGRSGAGWMLAIDGTLRVFTEIAPTFKELGTAAGMKQIGKSAASVAAGAAGWTAGEAFAAGVCDFFITLTLAFSSLIYFLITLQTRIQHRSSDRLLCPSSQLLHSSDR